MPSGVDGVIVVETAVSDESVLCRVTDNAAGMSEETRARVFEPFFTTRDAKGGTGLGLAIVHTIVKRHRGEIGVESAPGEGTTFTLSFPRASR
jgi:signal transduction histidine kinase